MHTGKVVSGSFKLGDTVTASIDVERRKGVRRAHTATHLLDAALKHVLGDHVHQAGSLVEPDRLRFDFTHFEAITPEQLAAVDAFVNDADARGHPRRDRGAAHRGGEEEGRRRHVRRKVRRCGPRGRDGRLCPWSSAAARILTTPPRSACSASRARAASPPVCVASRPSPASRRLPRSRPQSGAASSAWRRCSRPRQAELESKRRSRRSAS